MSWTVRVWWPALTAAALSGCRTPERTPHVPTASLTLRVIDAETRTPLPGAVVRLAPANGLGASTATAGADGVALLAAQADGSGEWAASTSAAGYLPDSIELHAPPGHTTPPPAEVALLAGPAPAARLTVPDGYLGPLVVTMRLDPAAAPARQFAATADGSGAATLSGGPAVRRIMPFAVTAAYAGGAAIPDAGPEESVRFQWVRTTGEAITFYVGTAADCDAYRKSLEPASHPSTGGRGSGQGGKRQGGGRRGGGGPAGSPAAF